MCRDRKKAQRIYEKRYRRKKALKQGKTVIRIFYSDNYYGGQILQCETCLEDKPSHRFEKQRGRFSKGKIKRTWCKDCCLKKRRYQRRKNYPSDSPLEPWQRREVSVKNIQQWWDKIKDGEIELPPFMLTELPSESIRIHEKKRDLPPSYPVWD